MVRFVEDALPNCGADTTANFHDRLFSKCMLSLGVYPADSRDINGEQRYHDVDPDFLYRSRPARNPIHSNMQGYWETLPHPDQVNHAKEPVGPRIKLEAAAAHSVSFHDIRHPLFQARMHAILYRTCPEGTRLDGSFFRSWKSKQQASTK